MKAPTSQTWKLTIEYDGTKYSGWQEQNNARTVQGQLRRAAEEFFEGTVDIQGAGRTDAGVHARAQVAHLRVRREKEEDTRRWPKPDEILRAINSRLPSDVCLLDVSEAALELPCAARRDGANLSLSDLDAAHGVFQEICLVGQGAAGCCGHVPTPRKW